MIVEIYFDVDNFCQLYFQKIETHMRRLGLFSDRRFGRMSLSEIMTILIFYHHSNYKNFKSYYTECIAKTHKNDFPQLVSYDRFIYWIPLCLVAMSLYLIYRCDLSKRTGIYFIDSTAIPACHPKRAHQNRVFKGLADWGKTSVGWFYGIKIHLIINELGDLIHVHMTKASTPDTFPKVLFHLTNDLRGWVFGDRGYLMNDEKKEFVEQDGKLIFYAKPRKNMKKNKDTKPPLKAQLWAKKRGIIESTIGIQKSSCDLEHTRHRSLINAYVHMQAALCAYTFLTRKPTAKIELNRYLIEPPKQMLAIAA